MSRLTFTKDITSDPQKLLEQLNLMLAQHDDVTRPVASLQQTVLSISNTLSGATNVSVQNNAGSLVGTQSKLQFLDSTTPALTWSLVNDTVGSRIQLQPLLLTSPVLATAVVGTTRTLTVAGTSNRITSSAGAQNLSADRTWTLDIAATYVGQTSITTLGTITTGTWNATPIGILYGGSGQTTANAALNAFLPTQTGNNGKFLQTDGSNTSWQSAGSSSPLTTKGDIYVYSTVNDRLPVGTDGFILSANSTEATGLKWIASTGSPGGLDSYVQYNNGGAFGGEITFRWDDSLKILQLGDDESVAGAIGFAQPANPGITYLFAATVGSDGDWSIEVPAASGTMAVSGTSPIAVSNAGDITITSAALSKADDTNVTLTLTGSPSTALLAATTITAGWTGTLSIARGGTGAGTALAAFNAISPLTTRGDLLTRDTTNNIRLAIGTTGKYLRTDGTDPSWQTIVAGDLPGSFSGFANPTGTIGLAVVNGALTTAMRSDAAPPLSQAIAPTWTALHIFATAARSSGNAPYFRIVTAADTGLTASTEAIGIDFGGSNATPPVAVTRTFAVGAITTQREYLFTAPTYSSASPMTITNAATVAINGAPGASGSVTITNGYALFVQGGDSRFASDVFVNGDLDVDGAATFDFNNIIKFENLTHSLVYVDGSAVVQGIAHAATGSVLISQGTTSAPIWSTSPSIGTITLTTVGTHKTLYTDGSSVVQGLAHVADGSVYSSKGTTTAPAYRTLNSTSNQVTVTTNAGNFTFSTPQDIATASTPQFARLGLGSVASSTAQLEIVGAVNPANSQFKLGSGSRISMLGYATDNSLIGFDVDWTSSAFIARNATVAAIYKTADIFRLLVGSGNTPSSAVTDFPTVLSIVCATKFVGMGNNFAAPLAQLQVQGIATHNRVSQQSETIDSNCGFVTTADYEIQSTHVIEIAATGYMEIL